MTGEDAAADPGFPLGRWLAGQRRYYGAGTLETSRVAQLDALGMVRSQHDVAWEEGLTVARSWAAGHGHVLPPVNAVGDGCCPIGVWAKTLPLTNRFATGCQTTWPGSVR
ncbi:helicase associated domain-containing protein [Streptomyces sp. NPDC052721]|uniref:helicase associated domain-containing protein n=1 Tax=Streptomyces sp. NPDC052721 TaxID=3154955 RepID=UPI00343306A7